MMHSKKLITAGAVLLILLIIGAALFKQQITYLHHWLIKPEISSYSKVESFIDRNQCLSCHQYGVKAPKQALPNSHSWPFSDQAINNYFALLALDSQFSFREHNRNALYQGEKLARQYHCFNCHGKFGQGGLKNAQSLKGYIPGWFGVDFEHLTNNNDKSAIEEWIRYGIYDDLINQPITGIFAQFIFNRQQRNMIRLDSIPNREITLLVDYVHYLHTLGEMSLPEIQLYQQQVRHNIDTNTILLPDTQVIH